MLEELMLWLTTEMTVFVKWLMVNSPNTITFTLAFLGVLYLFNMITSVMGQGITMIVYLFAFFIYNPYCWLRERFKKKENYVKEIRYSPMLQRKYHTKSYWAYYKNGERAGSAQTKELAEKQLENDNDVKKEDRGLHNGR